MTLSPTNPSAPALLGIDWGTSKRRAYLIDASGACLATHADGQGVLAAAPRFAEALAALLAAMDVGPDVPVLASGMIGSAQGWRQVPYLDIATPLAELPRRLVRLDGAMPGRTVFVVPGYSQRAPQVDVMRGEETQLLGALALGEQDGWMVLPGTHSKWVLLEDGAIRRFATFMTGECFGLLGAHGTLAPLMGGADDEDAFDAGLAQARERAPLTQSLFGVRARVVTGAMPAAQARSFVSGLLIGAEFAAALEMPGAPAAGAAIGAIAAPALQARYARAAGRFGLALRARDPDQAYRAALAQFLGELAR